MQKGSLKQKTDRHGVLVWRAQWRGSNGKGKTSTLGQCNQMTRAEARAKFDKILGVPTSKKPSAAMTLGKFIEQEYLPTRHHWKGSTSYTTEDTIRRYILNSELSDEIVGSITRSQLQTLLQALALQIGKSGRPLSRNTVKHVWKQLVKIFEVAKGDGLITNDPTAALEMPSCIKPLPKKVLTKPEMRIAEHILGPRELLMFRLTTVEGMRPGEAVALRLGDIQGDVITIEKNWYRGNLQDTTKTGDDRLVPMSASTLAAYRAWVDLLPDRRPEAFLFASETGKTPMSYCNLMQRNIRPILTKAGITTNYQAGRRTASTNLQDTASPKVVADLLGHSVDTSVNRYQQSPIEEKRAAMKKIEENLQ